MEEHLIQDPPERWSYFTEADLGMDVEAIKRSFASHVEYTQAKNERNVTRLDLYQSLARAVRDRIVDRWTRTQLLYDRTGSRRVYYLSLEFLLGRLLRDGLLNLGILEDARRAMAELDVDLDRLFEKEPDAGLGNGGLGRLAACFLDSMATLGIPAVGYGIRYEYGIFGQAIRGGQQVEQPDSWLRFGNPWEIPRPQYLYPVHFYGQVRSRHDAAGRLVFDWEETQDVLAMAYDLFVPGYRNGRVNTLRLWAAKASREFELSEFNRGDYVSAVYEKNATENISRVLYPADNTSQGKELRLKQEYFFVSATLQDALRRHFQNHGDILNFHEKAVFQLNDTHPALAVAELMRLLIDTCRLGWDEAWGITSRAIAYTNHTILPEALETWPVSLLERLLPRHLQIIEEIDRRFHEDLTRRFPSDEGLWRRVSLIGEGPERVARMANLAIVGSRSVNGVSELHSRLLKERIFPDFARLFPERFNNKTNGITPRRWLLGCNPDLAALITERIGDGWVCDLAQLERLAPLAEDRAFRARFREVKRRNKARLARIIARECALEVSLDSLFDIQVKRIHEYKRQLLNVLHLLALYHRIKRDGPAPDEPARTAFLGGKAAPGYDLAKRIIHLVHAVGDLVNSDPAVSEHLKVVFIPNYSVSLAEVIIPAADLSEQISTAGQEASGTGNMKFSLNGALTIGTLDGANIELREAVGAENFFLFGLTEPEVVALKERGYQPWACCEEDQELREVIERIGSGALAPQEPGCFNPLLDTLFPGGDRFLVLADFVSYRERQREVARAFLDQEEWSRRAILNVARMGRFSSDATIARYAEEIWQVPVTPR